GDFGNRNGWVVERWGLWLGTRKPHRNIVGFRVGKLYDGERLVKVPPGPLDLTASFVNSGYSRNSRSVSSVFGDSV
ncbi:MAG: hypothetical protein ACR2GB_04035, partial [Nocardioidaceae bacterium]